uniref:Uncharacterized protein n=1 Tax=Mycena chlorophos TaxID=658473 RepID=A0ABQ0LJ95_MYCCL|nr:predicted protein [Mycena chlorophos]
MPRAALNSTLILIQRQRHATPSPTGDEAFPSIPELRAAFHQQGHEATVVSFKPPSRSLDGSLHPLARGSQLVSRFSDSFRFLANDADKPLKGLVCSEAALAAFVDKFPVRHPLEFSHSSSLWASSHRTPRSFYFISTPHRRGRFIPKLCSGKLSLQDSLRCKHSTHVKIVEMWALPPTLPAGSEDFLLRGERQRKSGAITTSARARRRCCRPLSGLFRGFCPAASGKHPWNSQLRRQERDSATVTPRRLAPRLLPHQRINLMRRSGPTFCREVFASGLLIFSTFQAHSEGFCPAASGTFPFDSTLRHVDLNVFALAAELPINGPLSAIGSAVSAIAAIRCADHPGFCRRRPTNAGTASDLPKRRRGASSRHQFPARGERADAIRDFSLELYP